MDTTSLFVEGLYETVKTYGDDFTYKYKGESYTRDELLHEMEIGSDIAIQYVLDVANHIAQTCRPNPPRRS